MNEHLMKSESNIQLIEEKQLIEYLDVMGLATQLADSEKKSFLQIAKAFNLNPFKREIYCSKYGSQLSIITGYEVYIKRAERSGMLDGWNVVTEGKVDDGSLKAIITIHRKDRKHPFVHEVLYSEYVQKTKEGHITKFWLKAITMTKKVAMAQGFRLCFSDELGGMPYTQDEITQDVEHEVVYEKVSVVEESKSDLVKKYTQLVNDSSHVFTPAEQKTSLAKVNTWTMEDLNKAYTKVLTTKTERENALLSVDEENKIIQKQNDNQ